MEAGGDQRRDRVVPLRQHAARVVEPVVGAGQLLEVARDPMGLGQLGGRGDHAGELADGTEQVALTVVVEQRGVEPTSGEQARRCIATAGDARDRTEVGGVAEQRRDARMRVLHVEHRVVVRPRA